MKGGLDREYALGPSYQTLPSTAKKKPKTPCSSDEGADDQGGILAAEAEAVAQGVANRDGACLVRDVVEVRVGNDNCRSSEGMIAADRS
jgi:hypothetical protein